MIQPKIKQVNFIYNNGVNNKTIIFLFVAALSFLRCTSKNGQKNIPTPTIITIDSNSVSYFSYLDTILKSVEFIPLASTKNSVIGQIKKVLPFGNKIAILNEKDKYAVDIFDRKGMFLYEISSSKHEKISDFSIENNNIYLYLNLANKIEIFDKNGIYKTSISMDRNVLGTSFEILQNNDLLIWNPFQFTSMGNFRMFFYKNIRNYTKAYLDFPAELSAKPKIFNASPFDKIDANNVLISEPLDDTIRNFRITKDSSLLYPKYILKFDINPLPKGYLMNSKVNNIINDISFNQYSYYSKDFIELDSIIYFSYASTNNLFACFLNKNGKIIANSVEIISQRLHLTFPTPARPVWKFGNNAIAGYFHTNELLDWFKSNKNPKGAKQLLQTCSNMTGTDNPVLYIIHFK
jgi:hypothetical protein